MGFDFNYMLELLPILLKYLGTTMEMAAWGLVFSLILAVVLANLRVFRVRCWISLANCTSAFPWHPTVGATVPALLRFAASLSSAGGHRCLFRRRDRFNAALRRIHGGKHPRRHHRHRPSQMEASLSVGMTTSQAMRRVILPQATRVALPSLMNYFIDMIKSTSLAFTLGVAEIMAKAQMEASSSFRFFEAFLAVALIYWGVVLILTRVQTWAEAKLNKAYVR